MKKSLVLLSSMALWSAAATAQVPDKETTPDAFYIDAAAKTFAYFLPRETKLSDKITITNGEGVVVRTEEIDRKILAEGKYTVPTKSLSEGNYVIALMSGDHMIHSFNFSNKAQPELILPVPTTPSDKTTSFGFNPQSGEFRIGTREEVAAGSQLEVYDKANTLIASTAITPEMITRKEYTLKAGILAQGAYSVKLGGRKFGSVTIK